jgi:steroid delta-isomerase-like uncharacterized protein
MSIEENKALVRLYYELVNRGELDACYELFAPEFVFHSADGDMSREQTKQFDTMWLAAFPDLSATIEGMVAEGDRVSLRVTWRGTHKGEFMGITPTGKRLEITNANLFRIVSGKLVESWNVTDRLRFMQQLGVIPPK